MDSNDIKFMSACGKHGSYMFYRAMRFSTGQMEGEKILKMGEFFFAKISPNAPICIGEIQLLWEDAHFAGKLLTSIKLYFTPESTKLGKQAWTGEDELIAHENKIVLLASDVVKWIVLGDVVWTKGRLLRSYQLKSAADADSDINLESRSNVIILSFPQYCRYRALEKRLEGAPSEWLTCEENAALVNALGGQMATSPLTRIMFCRATFLHEDLLRHELSQDDFAPKLKGRPRRKKSLSWVNEGQDFCSTAKGEDGSTLVENCHTSSINSPMKYNPHKLTSKKLMSKPAKQDRTFDSVVPSLRVTGKPGRKRLYPAKERTKISKIKPNQSNQKDELTSDKDKFMERLREFMRKRNTPISKLPTIGFKEVDIYQLYVYAQKLGGYENISKNRQWKHIYDTLGGHKSNTSAATCTRRHYERLLLPFERHERNEEHKPVPLSNSGCKQPSSSHRSNSTLKILPEKDWETYRSKLVTTKKVKSYIKPKALEIAEEMRLEEKREEKMSEVEPKPGTKEREHTARMEHYCENKAALPLTSGTSDLLNDSMSHTKSAIQDRKISLSEQKLLKNEERLHKTMSETGNEEVFLSIEAKIEDGGAKPVDRLLLSIKSEVPNTVSSDLNGSSVGIKLVQPSNNCSSFNAPINDTTHLFQNSATSLASTPRLDKVVGIRSQDLPSAHCGEASIRSSLKSSSRASALGEGSLTSKRFSFPNIIPPSRRQVGCNAIRKRKYSLQSPDDDFTPSEEFKAKKKKVPTATLR